MPEGDGREKHPNPHFPVQGSLTSWAMCGSGPRRPTSPRSRTCVSSGVHPGSTLLTAPPTTGPGSPPGEAPGPRDPSPDKGRCCCAPLPPESGRGESEQWGHGKQEGLRRLGAFSRQVLHSGRLQGHPLPSQPGDGRQVEWLQWVIANGHGIPDSSSWCTQEIFHNEKGSGRSCLSGGI